MALPLDEGLDLIRTALEKERDERLFRQWVAQLPVMAMAGHPMSFDEYRDKLTGANLDTRPASEILRELEDVDAEFQKGEKDGT